MATIPSYCAQVGIVGLKGQTELEVLGLYGLPEAAPALLCGPFPKAAWSAGPTGAATPTPPSSSRSG